MKVRRQIQEVGHCGPTCISMLLESRGLALSPREIADAAGVASTIAKMGSRIDQLSDAIRILAPEFAVMGKFYSTLEVIKTLTGRLDLAVGVEWQGRFRSDKGPFDVGHFSIITGVDMAAGTIDLVDPDRMTFYGDGQIAIDEFERRWWEDNELEPNRKSRSFRLSFVVLRRNECDLVSQFGYMPISFDFVRHASFDL